MVSYDDVVLQLQDYVLDEEKIKNSLKDKNMKKDKPIIANDKPVIINNKPIIANDKPIIDDDKPIIANDKPVIINDKPIIANDKPIIANDKPVIINDKPIIANDKPVIINDKPIIIGKKDKNKLLIPNEQDSLFWCFFIINNGDIKYETIYNKTPILAKQLKIDLITKIRENKHIIKAYKFDTITNIENNLANENNMNAKTFLSLCAIENINVIYISKNTYFELLMNDTNIIYCVNEIQSKSKYYNKYGFEVVDNEYLNNIRGSLYKLVNIGKPIKPIISYKVQELIDISNKLNIEIINTENKKKTKKELYESIVQYF
jgi:hypothetical protein